MSDGISDAYREEREWDAKIKKLRENLKAQDAEMVYYKAKTIHDLAHNLWTGYQQDFSVRSRIYKPGVDLKKLLLDYVERIKEIANLPDDLPAGQTFTWYSDECYLKFKKHTLGEKK
jgi:hypothetical protein